MEQYTCIEGDDSSSVIIGPSETNLKNGCSLSDSQPCESVVTERSDCKNCETFDTLPDIHDDCPRPLNLIQEMASATCIMNEDPLQMEGEAQSSQRTPSPETVRHDDCQRPQGQETASAACIMNEELLQMEGEAQISQRTPNLETVTNDDCQRPLGQETASAACIMNEELLQMEEDSQISPRTTSSETVTHKDKGDADVVSLIDIETSLDHIQSNGCGFGDNCNIATESLQINNKDVKEMPKSIPCEKSDVVSSEKLELCPLAAGTVQINRDKTISSQSENQMECVESHPMPASLSNKELDKGLSNYAIMPGELTNELIEGPSITLPASELQNQCLVDSNKIHHETVPKSGIPSTQQFENFAQPTILNIQGNAPLSRSTNDTPVHNVLQTDACSCHMNIMTKTVNEISDAKTDAAQNSSSHSSSNLTAETASSLSSNPSGKQKIKKTPHDFIFGKVLGEGSYSTVHLAKEVSTQKEFAIKVCDKKHLIRERKTHFVMREKEILIKLDHPFFIKLVYTFQDLERLYYVLTYARNGELLTYLHKLSVFDVPCTRFYSAELVLALEYLQSIGIVHRDLKPENILFGEDMHIRITDFGTSKIMDSNAKAADGEDAKRKNSFVGTAEYVSPEVLNNLPANYGSDIWALGCITYQCLSSSPPFRCGNEYQTFQKIVKLDYEFPVGFNEDAKDLIQKLLVIEPNKRLGMRQPEGMMELKKHSFFKGIDWETLPNATPPKLLPYLPATGDNPEFWGGQEHRTGFDDQRLAEIITGQSIDGSQSPEVELVPVKGLQQMEEAEKREKLAKQRLENPFHSFVEDNLILRQGFVDKRKGLFARKRMLLLTEGPHLYYVDAHNKILKGEIPWSKYLRPEAKNFKIFFVHTPNRTYYLESRNPDAHLWVKHIQDVWKKYFDQR